MSIINLNPLQYNTGSEIEIESKVSNCDVVVTENKSDSDNFLTLREFLIHNAEEFYYFAVFSGVLCPTEKEYKGVLKDRKRRWFLFAYLYSWNAFYCVRDVFYGLCTICTIFAFSKFHNIFQLFLADFIIISCLEMRED